ncbi:MAG: anthranilate synthase component I family protein [Myxococcales bacterium]|nr:anthranilate synthase component I family protein [Myxococcales bacterium]
MLRAVTGRSNRRAGQRPAWWTRARAGAADRGPPIVPVRRELLCDGTTPLGIYATLRASPRAPAAPGELDAIRFLLESVGGGERWARYSVVGLGCRARVVGHFRGGQLEVEVTPAPGFALPAGVPARSVGLEAIEALQAAYHNPGAPDLPRFWGGLLGVWGHDAVRCFEQLTSEPRPASLPALDLVATDTILVFDNFTQRVELFATAAAEDGESEQAARREAEARLERIVARLQEGGPPRAGADLRPRQVRWDPPFSTEAAAPWSSARYRDAVARAQEFIAAGDIFQVVLSQAFDRPRDGLDPLEVYRMLRVTNPSPYMYLLELPSAALAGASPEVLVRVDAGHERRVTVRPLAGTRRRGADAAKDSALERELLADPKERAEHLMLVDLGRNDVGRVSAPGTVRVPVAFEVERYSKVMHIVSEVQGTLRPELTALDALRATFPAGTLSGAPKVRALELIDALEHSPRGWYGGAVGYLGYDGAADFAICIRSVVLGEERVHIQAGAGVVYDSRPEAEDLECQAKASAVLRAVAMARDARAREEDDRTEGTGEGEA